MISSKALHASIRQHFYGTIKTISIFFLFVCLATACQGDADMMTSTNPTIAVPENSPTSRPQNTPSGKQALKTATPTGIPQDETTPSPLNDVFWDIKVGQDIEEIRTLLGEPDATGSEGINTTYWDYADKNSKTMLRIRFRPDKVSAIYLYEGQYRLADLVERFGPPPLVYEADLTEERMGIYSRVFFAYPEQGFQGYIDHLNPLPEDKLDLLYQLSPDDLARHTEEVKSSSGIRVITWP